MLPVIGIGTCGGIGDQGCVRYMGVTTSHGRRHDEF